MNLRWEQLGCVFVDNWKISAIFAIICTDLTT
jgi:hypothetical protein